MDDTDLERAYPLIPWREPIIIHGIDRAGRPFDRYGCRYCIGSRGLRGSSIRNLPQTIEEARAHIAAAHPHETSL